MKQVEFLINDIKKLNVNFFWISWHLFISCPVLLFLKFFRRQQYQILRREASYQLNTRVRFDWLSLNLRKLYGHWSSDEEVTEQLRHERKETTFRRKLAVSERPNRAAKIDSEKIRRFLHRWSLEIKVSYCSPLTLFFQIRFRFSFQIPKTKPIQFRFSNHFFFFQFSAVWIG